MILFVLDILNIKIIVLLFVNKLKFHNQLNVKIKVIHQMEVEEKEEDEEEIEEMVNMF